MPFAASPSQDGFQAGRDLELGIANPNRGKNLRQRFVGQSRGLADQGDLAGVLDHPELFHQGGGGHRVRPINAGQPFGIADRNPLTLEAEPDRSRAADLLADPVPQVASLDHDVAGTPGLFGCLETVASVGNQDDAVAVQDQLTGRTGKAGEVANVGGMADQHGVKAKLVEPFPKRGLAGGAMISGHGDVGAAPGARGGTLRDPFP